jgi:LytS/YehU family sensor histidine kinase
LAQDERSPEIVMKLSELLDYMLYQGRKAKIPLSDELKLIANYIELEKLRYDDRLTVEMNIEGKPEGVHIAPLLLFPLVENAFKHGVWKIRGCVSIEILVYISTTNFRFTISNALKPEKETNKNNSGLGLRNLEKRLSLLYENRYSLTTSKKEGKFIAVLTLDLVERGLEP